MVFAKQYLEGDGIKNYNLRIIKPGEFVGLSAVFSENTFNYSSVALTDCHVFLLKRKPSLKWLNKMECLRSILLKDTVSRTLICLTMSETLRTNR